MASLVRDHAPGEPDHEPAGTRSSNSRQIDLSIVVPVHNEWAGIDEFYRRLKATLDSLAMSYEIIFVDDGSDDRSIEKLIGFRSAEERVKVLRLSRNFGKDVALSAGLEYARGDGVIPIDADLQDPPELIGEMIAKWREGFDVVYAARRSREGDSLIRRNVAQAFYWTINKVSEVPIPPDVGDFRLLDRAVVDAVLQLPEHSRFMKGLFAWVGFKQTAIYFERGSRGAGKTNWSSGRLWNFALDGLLSFSSLPLRIWSYLGMVISIFALCYAGFLIWLKLTRGIDVPGYPSLMVVVLFFAGVQLVTLGIMGEYVGRIYNEVKRRPLYLVREAYGFERMPREDNTHRGLHADVER
jgi:glycosyltransferase involved in cell wall biosynthesis